MSDVPAIMMVERPQLGFLGRAAALGSWVLAVALFLTVGWFAMEPDDPLGPVSVLARRGALKMLIQAGGLAAVTGGLATVIAGRRLADVGTFACVFGLAAVSLHGATAECLLVQGADVSASFERALALKFVLEAVGWLLVVIVAMGASALVMRWCFWQSEGGGSPEKERSGAAAYLLAGYDVPRLSTRCLGIPADRQTMMNDGVKHVLVATGVGLAAMALLSAGLSARQIQQGQVCFVVAATVFIGCYVAYRVVPVRSALWSIASVALIALVGYVWAAVRPAATGLPPGIPSSHFMRILPIQFISVGTAAALGTFWYVHVPVPDRTHGGDGSPSTSTPEERR